MGYLHIEQLYHNQDILLFKECYALEKIHGTSAHITLSDGQLTFSAGGEKHENFIKLFSEGLKDKISQYGYNVVIYGEAYGGKCQAMSATYGKDLKFIVFDVEIADCWLTVPEADAMAKNIGLEFVHYEKISTDLSAIDAQRDANSVQAVRNGMGEGHKREGVVLRPLIECVKSDGTRVICKHKGEEFQETATPRKVVPGAVSQVLTEANAIANEWITPIRLQHVLDKIPGHNITMMSTIIAAMQEDVFREGKGEVVDSKEARKAISQKTVALYKEFIKAKLYNKAE